MLARRALFRAAGAAGFAALVAALTRPRPVRAAGKFGVLVPDPHGVLDLPDGFTYRILERTGDPMDDGHRVPGLPDGMACFPGEGGTIVLMRNHELAGADGPYPAGSAPPEAYDPMTMGCVTRVVLDGQTFARLSSNLVLCGTLKNCAGGPSPWGWLTCEETTNPGHGHVFACDPTAASVRPPQPIFAYGRCRHEAACVDPARNIAYLTEDQYDSAFYRFLPDDPAAPFVGRLQALRVVGHDAYDMNLLPRGTVLSIDWVDITDPQPVADTLRVEARDRGAARFARGEGITFAAGEVYMIATAGGPLARGQIFRLRDDPVAPTLEALLVVDDPDIADQPDNVTVAPWGDLYFGEDGGGGNFIRGVTPDGQIFDFAHNVLTTGEFAGVCFSPDGRALFANLWGSGLTFVITGPFPGAAQTDTDGDDDLSTGEPDATTGDTGLVPTSEPLDPGSAGESTGGDPPELGGAFEELACACRSDAAADPATLVIAAAALAVTAPARRCDMQAPPTED